MRGGRVRGLGPIGLVLLTQGCGGGDRPSRSDDESPAAGSGADGGAGFLPARAGDGGTGEDTAGGGRAGSGGEPGGGGEGGGRVDAVCGDGVVQAGEACDQDDLAGRTCELYGFDAGTLGCTPGCEVDPSSCSGTEACSDGRDNDGDGAVDCGDADCADTCSDPCTRPVPLPSNGRITGQTSGHTATLMPACGTAEGSQLVYEVTPEVNGVMELELEATTGSTLSVRTSCEEDGQELGCAVGGELTVPVQRDERLLVIVTTALAAQSDHFDLDVEVREAECGDGRRDLDEECDDANQEDEDGCSSSCSVELSETEPNDNASQATLIEELVYGRLDDAADADVFQIELGERGTLVAETRGFHEAACTLDELDSALQVLAPDGVSVLAADDDGGAGLCPRITVEHLSPGLYFLRVVHSSSSLVASFGYVLDFAVQVCGDGVLADSEQCDDGNSMDGDGCDQSCRWESREIEPNEALDDAMALDGLVTATIADPTDTDLFEVVAGPSGVLTASASSRDFSGCFSGGVDPVLSIMDDAGTVFASDDDGGDGTCARLELPALEPAGTYYLQVQASPSAAATPFWYQLEVATE